MQLNLEKCRATTLEYYENWLGKIGCLASSEGSQVIYSIERNTVQAGYSKGMGLYIWVEPSRTIVSYGDAVKSKIPEITEKLTGDVFATSDAVYEIFGKKPTHAVKLVFQGLPLAKPTEITARTLTLNDYADYEKFFASYSQGDSGDWLYEYFQDIIQYNFCVGVYVDGILASCTDAATMPYMPKQVQDIGINTLEQYRGHGYATVACRKAAENILQGGRCPIWSYSYANAGSRRVSENLGFVKLSDVLMLEI